MNTLDATTKPGKPSPAFRWLALASIVAMAIWLGWKAWDVNITMSCWKDEWPHLAVCEEIVGRTPKEKVAKLQARLAQNPGDSDALVSLTIWANQAGGFPGLDGPALLKAAGKAAPQNRYVLLLQAEAATKEQRWPEAIDSLTRLSQYHGEPNAINVLADMIGASSGNSKLNDALLAAAKTNGGWVAGMLYAMPQRKIPLANAVPLVTQLMDTKQLAPSVGVFVIEQLKAEGLWLEAHAIWRFLWVKPLDLVFNGEFEQAFVRGGFDWEVADANDHRSGARIELASRATMGQVLRVAFTGKSISPPVLRQDLLLLPGQYVLRGKFQTSDLRSEKGLAWVVNCAKDGRELGRTEALKTTGREWTNWEAQVTMPSDCEGFGARLNLQPFAPYEATTGLRGDVFFDAVRLERNTGNP